MQGLVTTRHDVILNAFRIHDAAVGSHDLHLFGEERMLWITALNVAFPAFKRIDDGRSILGFDKLEELFPAIVIVVNPYQRSLPTKSHASDAPHFDVVLQTLLDHGIFKILLDDVRLGGHAARRHASAQTNLFGSGFLLFSDGVEVFQLHDLFPLVDFFEHRLGCLLGRHLTVIGNGGRDATGSDAAGRKQ